MKKKGNKKMPTPRHKLIHNPIPTSLFLSSKQCISCSQFNVKMFFSLPNAFTTNKQNSEQRCRDGVMNEFVSWCRYLLVSFLFHALTSLHPPSFHRNDFSTCKYGDSKCCVSLYGLSRDRHKKNPMYVFVYHFHNTPNKVPSLTSGAQFHC